MTTLPLDVPVEQSLKSTEQTLGFRITPELTLRVSHRARQPFGGGNFAHTAAISVVRYKRWM